MAKHPAQRPTRWQPRSAPPDRRPVRLPETTLVQVTGTDSYGDTLARPVTWDLVDGPPPLIFMRPEAPGRAALAPGERVLARLRSLGAGRYEGRTVRRLPGAPVRVLGVVRRGNGENRLVPTDRRAKAEWIIPLGQDGGAVPGEIVLAEPLPHPQRLGLNPARVIERLGTMGEARSVSLIAIHSHDIPVEFSPAAEEEAADAHATPLGSRTDLRDIPLITIDGEDARDFDDAVFAEPDDSLSPGGFRLIVAIADVAHYVRPGSALDQAALSRGNSVYFPDRVVPMLPGALSNGWCSLRPQEDRGCLFAEMWIDAGGRKVAHRFGRGLMRSAARLTYVQVQEAHDAGLSLRAGRDDGRVADGDLTEVSTANSPGDPVPLDHLYAAFHALLEARMARGALDLDLPERQVVLDDNGKVTKVAPRPRLDSHRLIEEFMVLANVAAAEELEQRHLPCIYRVHAPPSDEKLTSLRDFLTTLEISLPPGDKVHPRDLDRVLRRVAETPEARLVNEVMLRSQSQAAYSPDNSGHFGMALARYAHFTSPIRRYADLLVHRSLITGLLLGDGGLGSDEAARFATTADHITATERRAQLAERDALDRYFAAYMADKTGAHFAARISGVTRFALFVTVTDSGASGIVPISTLPDDYWQHDARDQTLTGRRTRQVFRLAQEVEVRLAEASPVTGGLVFQVVPETSQPGKRLRRR